MRAVSSPQGRRLMSSSSSPWHPCPPHWSWACGGTGVLLAQPLAPCSFQHSLRPASGPSPHGRYLLTALALPIIHGRFSLLSLHLSAHPHSQWPQYHLDKQMPNKQTRALHFLTFSHFCFIQPFLSHTLKVVTTTNCTTSEISLLDHYFSTSNSFVQVHPYHDD